MPIDKKFIGKTYGPIQYTVGLEKMREFAKAIGGGVPSSGFLGDPPADLSPLLHDVKFAKDGPYGDVIAFPTFAVTFAIAPFAAGVTDPELGINLLLLVHGEQELDLFDVIRPGDVLNTSGTITELFEKAGKDFFIMVTESKTPEGKLVVRGKWTAVIRHG